jgi:hypothetical protein
MTGVSVPAGEGDQFNDVPDRPNPISLFPWLLVAVGAAVDTVNGKFRPSWLAGAGLVLFAVLYLAVLRLGWGRADHARSSSCSARSAPWLRHDAGGDIWQVVYGSAATRCR